jgi:hypothetical protein
LNCAAVDYVEEYHQKAKQGAEQPNTTVLRNYLFHSRIIVPKQKIAKLKKAIVL